MVLEFLFSQPVLSQIWKKTKQILLFPLEESAHKRNFYIVYNKNRILKPQVRQFIHYAKNFYTEN